MTDAELETIAKAARPGPWKLGYADGSGKYDEEAGRFSVSSKTDDCVFHGKMCDHEPDAAHIVAFDPTTCLSLLTRLRSSEARVRELEGVLKQIIAAHEGSSEGAEVCCHMALLASNALETKGPK